MPRTLIGTLAVLGIAVACVSLTAGRASAEPINLGPLGTTAAASDQDLEIADALKRFRNMDFDGALALLQAAVKKRPELPPARLIMAQWFAQANQAAAVQSSLEQLIIEEPADPEAYVVLGDLALRGRRWAEAGLLYEKGSELLKTFKGSAKRKGPIERRALGGLATVCEARKDWPAAQKQLEALLALDKENAAALQQLGRVLFRQDKPTEALAKLKEAAAIDENVLTPQAILAQLYEQADDRTNAAKYMVEALTVNPRDLRTRLVAAQWSLETEQLENAEQQADAALKLDPDSLQAQILRGVVALFRKDYTTAEEHFQKAHLQSPSNFAASNNLALALCEQDVEAKKRLALEYAQVNAQRLPNQAEAASTLGWVFYKLERIDEAEAALRKAASGGSMSPDTAYYIARVSVDRGRKEQARQLLESALKTTRPFSLRKEATLLLESLN